MDKGRQTDKNHFPLLTHKEDRYSLRSYKLKEKATFPIYFTFLLIFFFIFFFLISFPNVG